MRPPCWWARSRNKGQLISALIYLSQYDIEVFHLPGRLNFIPDALSRLRTVHDMPERDDGEVVLDDIWFAYSEAKMNATFRKEFIEPPVENIIMFCDVCWDMEAGLVAASFMTKTPPQ